MPMSSGNMEEVSNYCVFAGKGGMGTKDVTTSGFTGKSKWVTRGGCYKISKKRNNQLMVRINWLAREI